MSYLSSLTGNCFLGGPSLKPSRRASSQSLTISNLKSTFYDGSDDHVSIGKPANLEWDPNGSEITISVWFRPSEVINQRIIVSKARMSDSNISYVMAVNSNASVYAIVGGTSNGGGVLTVSTWNHLLLTIRNVVGVYTFFLFLNGIQVGTGTAGAVQNTDMDWLIGGARWDVNSSISYPYYGNIDEPTFWNTAFTNADVTAIYNAGHPANPLAHSKAGSLLHWYRMGDGDTFPTITDRVGSANGTCVNMASAANFQSSAP